ALADGRFPQRLRPGAARRHDAAATNTEAAAERGERRRRAIVQPSDRRRMIREEPQRLIVEPGEAVAQERRLTIAENRCDNSGGRVNSFKRRTLYTWPPRTTPPKTSRCSKASSPSVNVLACTSAASDRPACIISSGKSSTTRLTRL